MKYLILFSMIMVSCNPSKAKRTCICNKYYSLDLNTKSQLGLNTDIGYSYCVRRSMSRYKLVQYWMNASHAAKTQFYIQFDSQIVKLDSALLEPGKMNQHYKLEPNECQKIISIVKLIEKCDIKRARAYRF